MSNVLHVLHDSDVTDKTSFSDPASIVSVDPESGSGSRHAKIFPSIKKCHVLEFSGCMDVLFRGLRRNIYPNFACNFFPLITNLRLYPDLAKCLDPDASPNR